MNIINGPQDLLFKEKHPFIYAIGLFFLTLILTISVFTFVSTNTKLEKALIMRDATVIELQSTRQDLDTAKKLIRMFNHEICASTGITNI